MKPERTPQTALIEQLHRLHDLCKSYDNGMCVAMDIAVALRTLLHDSPNGRSLSVLTQCGLRDKVKFLDTTTRRGTISFFSVGDNVSNKNIQVATHIYCGLLCKEINNSYHGGVQYTFSPLRKSSLYSDYEQRCISQNRFLSTKDWLDSNIFEVLKGRNWGEAQNRHLSRYQLFTILANKDGGAHYENNFQDKRMEEMFYNEYRDTQALHLLVNGSDVCFENTPLYPSVRQIAQKALVSLKLYLTENPLTQPQTRHRLSLFHFFSK